MSIYRDKEKIDFLITDSEGITLNLRLEKVLMKQYYYMDSVMRSMFPSQIVAEIKKLLQDVSTDEKMLSPDASLLPEVKRTVESKPINEEVDQ